ncbi:Zinc finger, RING/FYVE/PHD-type [Artemisia annua]|uniref:RING-type E3 ubiquitin transferase n=1 Tax=Artemisia annua TaxID=35608 RepID=A0A2U1LSF8_ARTAN|nr:Zinc finger, RING/FYVE/PHD-type [Artemisia annua]
MKTKKTLLPLLFFLFESISSEDVCSPTFCSFMGPEVWFPFRLVDRQPSSCGFPGFDLLCNEKIQTILKLPSSRSLIVIHISYTNQVLIFLAFVSNNFGDVITSIYISYTRSVNHSVYALEKVDDFIWTYTRELQIYCYDFSTGWSMPFCETCELGGGACALKDGEITCIRSSSHGGALTDTSYRLIIFIITGVPTLILAIVLVCYVCGKVRNYDQGRHQSIDLSTIAITPQTRSTTDLDGATIESYPKTILGESCELLKDDSACAICLSDYKPKEVVRTIPECSHYFHVDCIDEWLKLNATCPVCRKSSQSSLSVTPCSSTTLNSTNSSRTTSQ